MKRFERIQGNKASYWEIYLDEDVVITRAGRIGKDAKQREKEFPDDARAEDDYNAQIHAKRRQGWVEVAEPSQPLEAFEKRSLTFVPLDGSDSEQFDGEAMAYLLKRMVAVDLFDRHREADDLSRWEQRASRRAGVEGVPGPNAPQRAAWLEEFLRLSKRDRAAPMQNDLIGAFKYRTGTHWISPPEECEILAREGDRKIKRRKDKPHESTWVKRWVALHKRCKDCGYEIRPD